MGQLITWAVWLYSSPGPASTLFEVITAELLPIPTSGNCKGGGRGIKYCPYLFRLLLLLIIISSDTDKVVQDSGIEGAVQKLMLLARPTPSLGQVAKQRENFTPKKKHSAKLVHLCAFP